MDRLLSRARIGLSWKQDALLVYARSHILATSHHLYTYVCTSRCVFLVKHKRMLIRRMLPLSQFFSQISEKKIVPYITSRCILSLRIDLLKCRFRFFFPLKITRISIKKHHELKRPRIIGNSGFQTVSFCHSCVSLSICHNFTIAYMASLLIMNLTSHIISRTQYRACNFSIFCTKGSNWRPFRGWFRSGDMCAGRSGTRSRTCAHKDPLRIWNPVWA